MSTPSAGTSAAARGAGIEALRQHKYDADQRAVAYEAEAREQEERRQALLARMERAERKEPGRSAAGGAVAATPGGEESPALDPFFLRAPRIRPQADAVDCD